MGGKSLSQEGRIGLVVTTALSGRWGSIGISREDAFDIIKSFCQTVNKDSDASDAIKAFFFQTQDALMAFRKDDFYTIQKEPPFSDFAFANALSLAQSWSEGGEDGLQDHFNRTFSDGWEQNVPLQSLIMLKGGNGFSENEAIVIGVEDLGKRTRCEYWFLNYTFGDDCDLGMHMTTFSERLGKRFSTYVVTCPENKSKQVFFDITDQTYE